MTCGLLLPRPRQAPRDADSVRSAPLASTWRTGCGRGADRRAEVAVVAAGPDSAGSDSSARGRLGQVAAARTRALAGGRG